MKLQQSNIEFYQEHGYLIVEDVFSSDEIDALSIETETLLKNPNDALVHEQDQHTVRSINGPHFVSQTMNQLMRTPKILEPTKQLLDGDVYLHQYKINTKRAFDGDVWEWHSDYWFWHKEDGMPEPEALTAVIFLDDVNEFNGPMCLIPKSQNYRLSDELHSRPYGAQDGGENWQITTAKELKYKLSREFLAQMINTYGIKSAQGKKGSVLFFHSNLLHSSSYNSSPWDRRGIFISYNRVSNCLLEMPSPRPEFLASRNFTPLI
ncbi:MAG: phytanoyl-CoA dioxygenase family protein [Gammaproteobacteria bacterium]|nr:phytanoyl-CoA dioxygenase family protein [Gammaproteobacteria bacterium]